MSQTIKARSVITATQMLTESSSQSTSGLRSDSVRAADCINEIYICR